MPSRLLCLQLILGMVSYTDCAECALTGDEPRKPRYLKFCQDYNAKACCIPGHDLENQIQFEFLIDGLGPGCKNPMMYPNIRYYYCLGCDPDQPTYTTQKDDVAEVRICESFIEKLWDDYKPQYKECGVMRSNPCPDMMPDFDPYTCGDDLIIPPNEFDSGIDFMNFFAPPGMYNPDFKFVVGNESDCWQPRFMRSSATRLSGFASMGVMLLGAALRRLL
eukprot:CAMPEP_0119322860 /NCGR_PEP_ID=MMETSP1333-20130426/59367_1 /TAXON_ID=418940 /ORGANISM="Scyphosphaera apsteinii, Strain RCC1455" /LENGTH=219 /DNA_ID=CAMNT_0007330195 /DNA_START=65 /DNA_END=724 /DNA_ORIENTATION=+